MHTRFIILLTLATLFVSGCVSTKSPPETAYYTLSVPHVSTPSETKFSLGFITLADYLETTSIILQIDDSQLRPANYHRWGEPLASGIQRVLETLADSKSAVSSEDPRVDITINRFHGSIDGKVFLSGSFKVNFGSDQKPVAQAFSYESELTQDGYPALVKELNALTAKLAQEIQSKID